MGSLLKNGDAVFLLLDYTVQISAETTLSLADFVAAANVTEIELTVGECIYTLSDGDIRYDESFNVYYVAITQEQSFEFKTFTPYQLRLKRGNFLVCSSEITRATIGRSISPEVI